MFGFIRPIKSELRVKHAARFSEVYCGLCRAIRRRYGLFYPLFLSYDLTFFALLLEQGAVAPSVTCRCIAHPLGLHRCAAESEALNYAADMSVLLTYFKLRDSVADSRGVKRLAARLLCFLGGRGYRRAKKRYPEAERQMREILAELAEIEKAQTASLDRPADASARLLLAALPETDETRGRILRQLLYHIGRWLYLIDAAFDLADDMKTGSYNPIVLRYGLQTPDLSEVREALTITLSRSLVDVRAALALLDGVPDLDILENIVILGLPTVTREVLSGDYQPKGEWSRHGSL